MDVIAKSEVLASIIGVEGRRAFIFVEDDKEAEARLAFSLNGEPVHAAAVALHKGSAARGLNLLSNGRFEDSALPWRIVGKALSRFGRNLSAQWNLSNGFTGYLSAPANSQIQLEYVSAGNLAFIPIVGDEKYRFEGYFGTHRCNATVRIDLFDKDQILVTSLRESIPRMLGGSALSQYAKKIVEFLAPSNCAYVQLRLSIDQYVASAEDDNQDAYLFFTHLSFVMVGENALTWRPDGLSGDQLVALTRGAAILDVTLPRLTGGSSRFEVIDLRTGEPAKGSPILLSMHELAFVASSFDGVTLAGRLTAATGKETLELAIDGMIAGRLELDGTADGGVRHIKLRVADDFLDGSPHVLELRDAATGQTLLINAVTLKSMVTPWEALEDFSRSPLPLELHPMARRRYQNIVAHLEALTRAPTADKAAVDMLDIQQLGRCHELLSSLSKQRDLTTKLTLPVENDPEVTVLLSASDIWSAYRTIAALILAHNKIRYEVIVAFNGRAEDVNLLREFVPSVKIIEAMGEASRASLINKAAKCARGRFIVLLGAPAEPSACWLDELRRGFELFDGVGLLGCKLIKPNGRLYEAGGILWSSGNWQPVGSNGNAEHPQVNYTRQVDYVSALAAMMPRNVWESVGGMSEDLPDPTLEDVDLALKVRSRGHKVVYAPHAVVTTEPGNARPSTGSDLPLEFKRRWVDAFSDRHVESPSVQGAMDYGITERILFIDQQIPRSDIDAGSYAAIQEMRLFQALGYKITFLPMNLTHAGVYTRALERMGVEVIRAPFAVSIEDALKERGAEFKLVYITRHHVARAVLPFVRRFNPAAKVIFNNADLHFLRELRAALAQKNDEMLRRSRLTRDHELEVMRLADLTLSYNEVEHAVIQSHNLDQTKVAKAPWVVTTAAFVPPYAERKDIGFLGSFGHRPNVDAVKFFVSEIMPLVRVALPGVRFLIIGSQIGQEVRALECGDVLVKGHVDDLAEAFGALRLFVAPLIAGAGIKGKVLAAMSFGVPSVLSPAAAEGIGSQSDIHHLTARVPSEWVRSICDLYGNEMAWSNMSQSALKFVVGRYSFQHGGETLRQALEMISVFPARNTTALCCSATLPPLV